MKKQKRSGKGGSYFQASPDAERVLVSGTDQKVSEKPRKVPDVKKQRASETTTGDE